MTNMLVWLKVLVWVVDNDVVNSTLKVIIMIISEKKMLKRKE